MIIDNSRRFAEIRSKQAVRELNREVDTQKILGRLKANSIATLLALIVVMVACKIFLG